MLDKQIEPRANPPVPRFSQVFAKTLATLLLITAAAFLFGATILGILVQWAINHNGQLPDQVIAFYPILVEAATWTLICSFVLTAFQAIYPSGPPGWSHERRSMTAMVLLALAAAVAGMFSALGGISMSENEKIVVRDNRVYWCGNIAMGSYHRLITQLNRRPARDWTLVLQNNSGGVVATARQVLDNLEALGIKSVEASGLCASACAMLWASAPHRLLAKDTTLGFHSPYNVNPHVETDAVITERAQLVAAGWPPGVADRLMGYGPTEMGFLSQRDLDAMGIQYTAVPRRQSSTEQPCGTN